MAQSSEDKLVKAIYSALITTLVSVLASPITWGIKVLITVVVLRWMGVDI